MQFSLIILSTLICFGSAIPTQSTTSTPVPSNLVTSFPVCGTLGFTGEPGDNDLGIFPPPPISKADCILACRYNSTCKAVSYAPEYELCSFYAKYMKHDHLQEDKTSNFEHFDETCRAY